MSSNDRQNRYNREHPAPSGSEPLYEDEVLFEDDWDVEFEDPYQQPQAPGSQKASSQPPRPPSRQPSNQGTAAQIDRLRRNLSQSTRSSVSQPARSSSHRPPSQTASYASPVDDTVYPGDAYDDQAYVQPSPTRQRQSTRPLARASSVEHDTSRVDSDYGEFDAYEDFDDGFSEYDAARAPRSAPQLRMPSITKPTLPAAIAKADLVNDAPSLGIIGIGLASLAAMAILVANRVDSLAPQFATHVSASGVLENFQGESAIWKLPLMAAMFTLMNMVIAWFVSPIDRFASRFVLAGAVVVQFVAWVALFRIL